MLKYILFLAINIFLINPVNCESRDTAIYYYKFHSNHPVNSLDSADYFRVILPADSGDHLNNIREYYKKKDGHPDHFETLGKVSPELHNALADALAKCRDWTPGKFYGIPYRAKITLPLIFIHGYTGNTLRDPYREEVFFEERILGY